MTNKKHDRNAKQWGMTSEEYAALRYFARINLDKRLKKNK